MLATNYSYCICKYSLRIAFRYLLMLFFCANICQSLPLALGVSNVAHILCLMEYGILKAFGPVCAGKLLSSCAKKVIVSLSFCA